MDVAVRTVNLRKTYLSRGSRRVAVSGLSMTRAARRGARLPRPQRVGQDDDDPDAARARAAPTPAPRRCSGGGAPAAAARSSTGSAPSSSRRSSSPPSPARQNLVLLAGAIGTPARTASTRCSRPRTSATAAATGIAGFSLGMKQRLAIAATLLKDPDLLIFDEPTNGLDPAGIREVRDTMRSLGAQGKTVLVSSHILREVEQVADTVSIIGHGLAARRGTRQRHPRRPSGVAQVRVGVASPDRAAAGAADDGFARTRDGEHLVVGADGPVGRHPRLSPATASTSASSSPVRARPRVRLPRAHRRRGARRGGRPGSRWPRDGGAA